MTTFKVGDLVRVQGASFNTEYTDERVRHHIKPGSVCVVLSVGPYGASISGPCRYDSRPGRASLNNNVGNPIAQGVHLDQLKLAKQAMKQRDLYAARR